MLKERVRKFNTIAGKPEFDDLDEQGWLLLENQAKRVFEEAKEMLDSVQARDFLGVVDGWCDVEYTNVGIEVYLERLGVNLGCCLDVVALNNDQKYTRSEEFAKLSALGHSDPTEVKLVEYNGDKYYVILRKKDQKVMKLRNHVPPELSIYIPNYLLKNTAGDVSQEKNHI